MFSGGAKSIDVARWGQDPGWVIGVLSGEEQGKRWQMWQSAGHHCEGRYSLDDLCACRSLWGSMCFDMSRTGRVPRMILLLNSHKPHNFTPSHDKLRNEHGMTCCEGWFSSLQHFRSPSRLCVAHSGSFDTDVSGGWCDRPMRPTHAG